ncbi:RWD domain-containing protein 3 isoform 2-T4 [Molossus nigricans]
MAGPAQEELEALAAIYCGPGEWEVLSRSESDGPVFRILTKAEGPTDADTPLELVFHLPVGYPSCLPGVSVSSEHLTRAQRVAVRDTLLEQAQSLLSEPMVHQLVLWVQQNLRHILAQPGLGGGPGKCPAASIAGDEGPWMTLLHLDHMRAKNKYVKTVLRSIWCFRKPPKSTWTRVGRSAERRWSACSVNRRCSQNTRGSGHSKSKSFRRWMSYRRNLKLQDLGHCSSSLSLAL